MTYSRVVRSSSSFAPFGLCKYSRLRAPCLHAGLLQCIPLEVERNWVCDTRNGVYRLSVVGHLVKRWIHWNCCGNLLRRDVATYVDTPFPLYTEEDIYASRLAIILCIGLKFADAAPVTYSLEYVAFRRPFESLHLLTYFEYLRQKIQLEQR